jgi:hypothetical protein
LADSGRYDAAMHVFWEVNSGHRFYGHLKLGEAQSAGYDVHGTFPRDGSLPHISVYEVSSTGGKVERNLYLHNANGTVGLTAAYRAILIARSGVSQTVADEFVIAVYKKHLQLNPPSASASSSSSAPSFSASDFPALGGARSSPPLVAAQPVAVTPAQRDPLARQLADLPGSVRSAVLGSGAFD